MFCHLDAPVFSCVANQSTQYSHVGCVFPKKQQCMPLGLTKQKSLRQTLLLTIFLHWKVAADQKMTKGSSFETFHRTLTCLVKLRPRMPHILCFLDCYSFSQFLASSYCFYNLRLSSLNSELNFG